MAVIIFKSVGYIRQILTQLSINGHKQKAKSKKREWLRYRDFVLSPYGVIKIKSLGYRQSECTTTGVATPSRGQGDAGSD
ncbi:hypothetical protein [Symbiopectobacterium sp. RP]|uniref:hypothetical protein n=1 Tax=Symbiopectobacterium sp. RP TaxID=3248553 RepID=UPI003D2CD90D